MDNKKDIGKLFKDRLQDISKSPEHIIWKDIEKDLEKDSNSKFLFWRRLAIIIPLLLIFSTIGVIYYNAVNNSEQQTIITYDESKNIIQTTENQNNKITKENHQNKSNTIRQKTTETLITSDHNKQKSSHSVTESTIDSLSHIPIPKETLAKEISTKKKENKSDSNFKVILSEKTKSQLANNQEIGSYSSINNKETSVNKKTPTSNKIKKETISPSKKNTSIASTHNLESPNASSENINTSKNKSSEKSEDLKKEKLLLKSKKDTLLFMEPLEKKKQSEDRKLINFALRAIPAYIIPGNGSLINDQYASKNQKGKLSLNYGVLLSGHLTDKIDVRVGYNGLRLNTRIDTILNVVSDSLVDQNLVSLTQRLDYHEVSLEMGYQLINKKIDIDLIGGFSFLILKKSDIIIPAKLDNFMIRDNNNIKKYTGSFNIGSSIKYALFKDIFLTIEPTFKYQLKNASKNSKSYKPFYFVLPVGISIDF